MPQVAIEAATPFRSIHLAEIGEVKTHCQKIWAMMDRFPTTAKPVKDEVLGILGIVQGVEGR